MTSRPVDGDLPIEALAWDEDNREHIARHGLDEETVHEVLEFGSPIMIRNRNGRTNSRQVIGYDTRQRCWTIVVEPANQRRVWRARTGWQSSPREIALYWQHRKRHG